MTTTPLARLVMVNIDCADPPALAAFYGAVTGWEIVHSEQEYAMLGGDTPVGFGRVEGYRPPRWPDDGKQFHLDFSVDDIDAAVESCRTLGASVPEFQPGAERWRVLLDPAGHPFCLCRTPDGA